MLVVGGLLRAEADEIAAAFAREQGLRERARRELRRVGRADARPRLKALRRAVLANRPGAETSDPLRR